MRRKREHREQAAAEEGAGQRGERVTNAVKRRILGDEAVYASDKNRRNKNGFYQSTGSMKIGLATM